MPRKPKSFVTMIRNGVETTTDIFINHNVEQDAEAQASKGVLKMHHHSYKGNHLWSMLQKFFTFVRDQILQKVDGLVEMPSFVPS